MIWQKMKTVGWTKLFNTLQEAASVTLEPAETKVKVLMKAEVIRAQYDEHGNVMRDENGVNIGVRETVMQETEVSVDELSPELRRELGLG